MGGGYVFFFVILIGFLICYFVYLVYSNRQSIIECVSPAARRDRHSGNCCSSLLKIYRESYEPLRQCPAELWLIYFLKFLESYAYFSSSLVLAIYLTEEFGYDDIHAGFLFGLYGLMSTLYGAITGPILDYIGIKNSLALGGIITFVGRVILAGATSRVSVLITLLLIIPFGMSLLIPVMTVAVKRYTNEDSITAAFGLYYTFMNVAALFSGFLVDIFFQFLTIRWLLATGAITSLLLCLLSCFKFRDVSLSSQGNIETYKPPRPPMKIFLKQTFKNKLFYKLMALSLFVTGVRMIFRHLDGTFPKYWEREGKTNFGSLYSINPAIIIVTVPLIAGATKHFDDLSTIIAGSWMSSVSVFFLCIGAYYWSATLFIVILSIGEAFYSPRVYEYAMKMAPKGYEGIYTNLSSAPLFMAKMGVGAISGYLLQVYCPEGGPVNQCWKVWFWVGISAISSPICMMIFKSWISYDAKEVEMSELKSFDDNNDINNNNNDSSNINHSGSEDSVSNNSNDDSSLIMIQNHSNHLNINQDDHHVNNEDDEDILISSNRN